MAANKCYNRSSVEYKTLLNEFKSVPSVDMIIDSFQKASNNDVIPTVEDAKQMLKDQKTLFSLKQRDFGVALLANLARKGLITKLKNKYYVVHTDPITGIHSDKILRKNLRMMNSWMEFWNLDPNLLVRGLTKKKLTFNISLDNNLFTVKDLIERNRNKDSVHASNLITHLLRTFPSLSVEVVKPAVAYEYYQALSQTEKAKVPFDQIKSYVHGEKVKLIQGRFDTDTVVEEILHPFIESAKIDNKALANSLYREAVKAFPALLQEVEDSYTDGRGFTANDRATEFLTKALARTFNKEFEENTNRDGFLNKVKEFIQWFLDIVKDYYRYITDNKLVLPTAAISENATLSDVAKLLNTDAVTFDLKANFPNKVRYSLAPETKNIYDYILSQANEVQSDIVKNLFYQSVTIDKEINQLTSDIITLDRNTHTYIDIETGETYKSVTTAIKGQLDDMGEYKLNRDIGDDFDVILESLASGVTKFEDIPKLKVLPEDVAEKAYNDLNDFLNDLRSTGSLVLPQIILSDRNAGIAGTADIVVIKPDGKIGIIDLKTSKNSIGRDSYRNRTYPVNEDSMLYQQDGTMALSTRMQHGIQVNMYRRLFENMGYELDPSEQSSSTYHILVTGIEGRGSEQTFDNLNFETEGFVFHKPMDNKKFVDQIVPKNINPTGRLNYRAIVENSPYRSDVESEDFITAAEGQPEEMGLSHATYKALYGVVLDFGKKLFNRNEAIKRLKNERGLLKDKDTTVLDMQQTISAIGIGLSEGKADILYTKLLQKSLRELEEAEKYLTNEDNFGSSDYIAKVNYIKRYVENFRGLTNITETSGLSSAQLRLKDNLANQLNKLADGYTEVNVDTGTTVQMPGILETALENYVKFFVATKSQREFSEEELDNVIKFGRDLDMLSFYASDLATASDTLLALMDKEYKRARQLVLDLTEKQANRIRINAESLRAISKQNNIGDKELYHYMLNFDNDGNFLGTYVKQIGSQYNQLREEAGKDRYGKDGEWLDYIRDLDISLATPEQIEYNKKVFEARQKYSLFMRPEQIKNGLPVDGDYHKYTDKFKEERRKHQRWISTGDNAGYWSKRADVTEFAYNNFKLKYFETIEYDKAIRKNGEPTGVVTKGTIDIIKKENTEIRLVSSKGESMVSEKYDAIMNDTSQLGIARRNFYNMYVEVYENELLNMLPGTINGTMSGNVPLIKSRFLEGLSSKPDVVQSMTGRALRGFKNFFQKSSEQKFVGVDEFGNLIDQQLPVYYVGSPRDEAQLLEIDNTINSLVELANKEKNKNKKQELTQEIALLRGKRQALQTQPSLNEISLDMGDSLLRFAGMAQNFQVMTEMEETFKAIIEIIDKREYEESGVLSSVSKKLVSKVGDTVSNVYKKGAGSATQQQSYISRRAKKWLSMTFYKEDETKVGLEKAIDGLISYSSLTYVGLNFFGNISNYGIARINNAIETIGARFYDRDAGIAATREFNVEYLPGLMKDLAYNYEDATGQIKYKKKTPGSKYAWSVNEFRMMDDKADIREVTKTLPGTQGSYAFRAISNIAYSVQDAAEFNVQTKVGNAILRSVIAINSKTGEEKSFYDIISYDNRTGEATYEEGFDKVKLPNRTKTIDLNDDSRREIRNYIREVNKQIHGNYAYEDRMIIQSHAIGRLAAQFHKWIAPAVKARFRREYFDENLGWLEGRYLTAFNFLGYIYKTNGNITKAMEDYKTYEGDKAKMKIDNLKRVGGELSLLMMVYVMQSVLSSALVGDDDSDRKKRLVNSILYTVSRLKRDMLLFMPSIEALDQGVGLVESPIPSTRIVRELAQALQVTFGTGWTALGMQVGFKTEEDFQKYVYQRTGRKGQLKLKKEWMDAIPMLYTLNRWASYDTVKDFYVK